MATKIKSDCGQLIIEDTNFENDDTTKTCYATWRTNDGRTLQVLAKKVSLTENDYMREINSLKRLKHANIISYIEGLLLGENLIIITEIAPKGSLHEHLKHQRQRLPPELLFRWALDIARAIRFLQENRIVHRDIKSPNFVIAGDTDSLKLQNFGLAQDMFQSTKSSGGLDRGSLPWMAPEVIREKRHSSTSDTYSWAVIIWELLTGKEPFAGKSGGLISFKVTSQHARLDIPGYCSEELKRIIVKAWDHDRRKRPSINQVIDVVSMNRQIFGPEWKQEGNVYVDGSKWHYTRGLTFFGTKQHVALCCWERPSGGRGAVEIHTLLKGEYTHEYTVRVNTRNWRPWDVVAAGGDLYVVCAYNKNAYRFPCSESFKENAVFALTDGAAQVDPYCIAYEENTDTMIVCLEHQKKAKVIEYCMPDFKPLRISVLPNTPTNHSIDINVEEDLAYVVVCDADGVHIKGKDMKQLSSLQIPSNATVDAVTFGKGPLSGQIFIACETFGQVSIYRYISDSNHQFILAGSIVEGIKEAPKVGLIVSKAGTIAVSERMGHTVRIFKIGHSKANFVSL